MIGIVCLIMLTGFNGKDEKAPMLISAPRIVKVVNNKNGSLISLDVAAGSGMGSYNYDIAETAEQVQAIVKKECK